MDLVQLRALSIDLSPLSSCINLKSLSIYYCDKFTILDLSPLKECKSLESLIISHNTLRSLDLSPLAGCTTLSNLTINHNKIKSIDLSPLSNCRSLTKLSLMSNRFRSIDVRPIQGKNLKLYVDDKMENMLDDSSPRNIEVKMCRYES